MLGLRNKTGHSHEDSSYWAGPGLVRMVCNRCHRVSFHLCETLSPPDSVHSLAVDDLAWLACTSA